MTEPTDTAPTEPTSAEPPTSETEPDSSVADLPPTESEPSPNSEAARWRTKLRDTEAQRDALTERLTGYQRRECEAAVADLLDVPGDLFEVGMADVHEFYNPETGELNEGELRAAAGALCEMRPKLAKPPGPRHQNFGQYTPPPPAPGIGWESVLKG